MVVQRTVVQNESGSRRTQIERRTAAEDGLLDAAAELFAERGVTETSMAQIGERAGYSRGLANHHFGSKSTLVERLAHRVQAEFADSLTISETDNALDAVLRIVGTYLNDSEALSSGPRALFVMWGATFPAQSSVVGIAEADERTRATLAMWIERGQVDGSVSGDVQPVAFSAALIGMLRGVIAQHLTDPSALDLPAVRAECQRFVLAGLSPAGADTTKTKPNKKLNEES